MAHKVDNSKFYVFYDGDCGFCNGWIQWILEHDKKDRFLFASLQSEFGQNFLRERGLNRQKFNTLYLWKPQSYYLVKSQAVSEIAKILGGKYALMANLNFFPRFLSDKIYDKVAENRQKLAGKTCKILTEEQKKKFVE